jgi:hypothetical protein
VGLLFLDVILETFYGKPGTAPAGEPDLAVVGKIFA